MLTFASLLLGLTLGFHEIEVLADDEIVAVELFLDGASAGRVERRPFKKKVDFGPTLRPHKLEAIGFGADGVELARTVQWINLPRPPAEISAIFEEGPAPGIGVVARLRWAALAGAQEPSARAWFDGVEIEVADPRTIPLPEFDEEQLHFFRVELTFPGQVVSSFEATLGGAYADKVTSGLTAVLLSLTRKREPTIEELSGSLVKEGAPLEIVAIDKPPAQIVVVRDRSIDEVFALLEAQRALGTSSSGSFGSFGSGTFSSPTTRVDRIMARRLSDWRLEFLWPVAERRRGSAGRQFDLFAHTPELGPEDGSLYAFLTRIDFPPHLTGKQRLADSLAVAGLSAAALGGRRTAILILDDGAEDRSGLSVDVVRDYLEQIQVPLEIWTTARRAKTPWGKAARIVPRTRLDAEWRRLLEGLERQRIAWVRGSHLPQSIELQKVAGLELVR